MSPAQERANQRRAAADILRLNGKVNGRWGHPGKCRCMAGAIGEAAGPSYDPATQGTEPNAEFFEKHAREMGFHERSEMYYFSDNRTVDQVIEKLMSGWKA